MLLPPALGFSPHPPVSVYGTGTSASAFPGSDFGSFRLCSLRIGLRLAPVSSFPALPLSLRPLLSLTQYWNINQLSIDYAFRPRLRSRLPQSRSALLWKPWIFGLEDSHLHLATHSGILSSQHSTAPSGTASPRCHCSSTACYTQTHGFGVVF